MSEPRLSDEQAEMLRTWMSGELLEQRPIAVLREAIDDGLAELRHLRLRTALLEDMVARMRRDDATGHADAAMAMEREACAALADAISDEDNSDVYGAPAVASDVAKRIRARGSCLPDLPELSELERLRAIEAAALATTKAYTANQWEDAERARKHLEALLAVPRPDPARDYADATQHYNG